MFCREEHVTVDASTNDGVDVVAADAESENKVITKDRRNAGCNIEAPAFIRLRSWQATGDIEVVRKRKSVDQEKSSKAAVASKDAASVPEEVTTSIAWSRAKSVCSASVKDADLVALNARIHELQADNEDL